MDVELTPRRLSVYEEQLLRNIDNSIEHYAISKAKVSCPMALLVVLLTLKKFRNGIVPNNTRLRRRYIPSSIAILREISFPIESRSPLVAAVCPRSRFLALGALHSQN
jgi:hypothetical protein